MDNARLIRLMEACGAGRKKLDDSLFSDLPPARLGVYDIDDEELCHTVLQTRCPIPGCNVVSNNLLESEDHYNAAHRFICSNCRKNLPTAHLLDLHVQEQHDSFFAVLSLKKPSYACYIEECKEKFITAEDRFNHGVETHNLPKDFRFDKKKKQKTDAEGDKKQKKFSFHNSRKQMFKRVSIPKFTSDEPSTSSVDMDAVMADIMESLPDENQKR